MLVTADARNPLEEPAPADVRQPTRVRRLAGLSFCHGYPPTNVSHRGSRHIVTLLALRAIRRSTEWMLH
jgi:hypothetical protein